MTLFWHPQSPWSHVSGVTDHRTCFNQARTNQVDAVLDDRGAMNGHASFLFVHGVMVAMSVDQLVRRIDGRDQLGPKSVRRCRVEQGPNRAVREPGPKALRVAGKQVRSPGRRGAMHR
ncbi:MAG: hypothetical protein CM15mP18_4670 [Methanobacteriota archaeon]|nr:MAG: hypothetical protein CM15mP18_4670 [Euryarchaeota archaeon]